MADMTTTTPNPGSQANVLSPGIVGLFIQGIGTAFVFTQITTWLSLPGHTEHRLMTVLTVFITTVGLFQSLIVFLSSWKIYVQNFGEQVVPTWAHRVHIILTVLIATPVQLLLICRCYHILKRNKYFIMLVLVLLLGSVVLAIVDTVWLFLGSHDRGDPGPRMFWVLLMYRAFSSFLDIILSSILFYYLIRSKKRVFSNHVIEWISRHTMIAWQSAIPPTACVTGIFIVHIVSHRLYPGEMEMWYPTIQGMIGQFYVLSYFYYVNARPLDGQEQSATCVISLTIPAVHRAGTSAFNTTEEHPMSGLDADSSVRTDHDVDRDSKTTPAF